MQNNSLSRRNAGTLYKKRDDFFVPQNQPLFTNIPRNAAAVPKLSLTDKAGLVFVVAILLMLQILEKLKVIK